jgi:hypothetical protein
MKHFNLKVVVQIDAIKFNNVGVAKRLHFVKMKVVDFFNVTGGGGVLF